MYRALAPRLRDAGHDVVLVTQQTPYPIRRHGIETVTLPRTDDVARHRIAVDGALADLCPDLVECST
ncbi:hypothetical protein [Kutzneria sp. CA-103260]|uniref:hypothetical protein n=1 Tax=Kutzneria sp. CA-103260 TaxID=2802641 RepID=UPI001BAAB3BC|nr:hypothetical protein [Kutzneria sp. CA-103260]QUQ65340.1 hypothetical protein JJ691_30630 [Kutzneria sp. CA-103260]